MLKQDVENYTMACEKYLCDVEHAFEILNWYASGEHMKNWSRTDPQAVIGEVYLALAVNFNEFKNAVRGAKE